MTQPEPDCWALTIHFDDLAVQEKTDPELAFPQDECSRLIAYLIELWGLLPETFQEIAEWDANRITLHLDTLQSATEVMHWIGTYTVPQSVLLRRNESR
jgi:hypothetical protein